MARLSLRLRRRGVVDLLQGSGTRDEMERRAKAVAREAQSRAPVVTGEYRDSIVAVVEPRSDRNVGRVYAQVPYAAVVEAKHRTLGRAIDAARG